MTYAPNFLDASTGFTGLAGLKDPDSNPFDAQYALQLAGSDLVMFDANAMEHVDGQDSVSDGAFNSSTVLPRARSGSGSRGSCSSSAHTHHKGSNSSKRSSSHGSDQDLPATAKRAKFLERNRLAASKCRMKKKEWTQNLEAAARQASAQSRELQVIVGRLREELLEYKTQLLYHQDCGCQKIKEYLQNEVNLVQPNHM